LKHTFCPKYKFLGNQARLIIARKMVRISKNIFDFSWAIAAGQSFSDDNSSLATAFQHYKIGSFRRN
jgi:hypothetical protein